jgi:hypothetical protein
MAGVWRHAAYNEISTAQLVINIQLAVEISQCRKHKPSARNEAENGGVS